MKHPENKSRDVKPKTVPNKTVDGKYDTKKPRPSIKETLQKFRANKLSNEGKLNKTRESKGDLSKGVKSTKEDTRKQKLLSVIKNPEPTPRKSKVEGKGSKQEAAKGNYDNSDNKKFNVLDAYKDKINSNRKGNLTKEKNTFQPSSATNKELIDKEKQLSSPQKNVDSKEKIIESTPNNKPEPISSKEEKKSLETKQESILKQDENKQEKQPEADMADKSEATSISSTEQQNRMLSDAKQDANEKSLYEKKFEELTNDEIHYLLDNDIKHLTAVNEDYKERYSAESMGMTQEEYRAHNDRLAEENKWDKFERIDIPEHIQPEDIKTSLQSFEQKNWESLSLDEKKEKIEAFAGVIAKDLELNNPPEVKYYQNENTKDCGAYSRSENTIYINELSLDNGKEVANTVAHESRHAWQHERAENPETDRDYQLKDNFENYIRPENNYRRYCSQIVEADADIYAKEIVSSIKEYTVEKEVDIVQKKDETVSSYSELNPEKGTVFDVKDLPSDILSKQLNIDELRKNIQDVYSTYYEKDNGNLTESEKESLVKELQSTYLSFPEKSRGDVNVPARAEDVDYIRLSSYGYSYVAKWDNTDGALNGTRTMEVIKEGQIIDRVGHEYGTYFSPVENNKKIYSANKRAIPNFLPLKDLKDEPSYNQYIVKHNFTYQNFLDAINRCKKTVNDKEKMKEHLDEYYSQAKIAKFNNEPYSKNGNEDGVKTSVIAPMFKKGEQIKDGGGKQYDTPFDAKTLFDLGMIDRVKEKVGEVDD